ncbi:MAG: deoxyribodipyrimidine photo-lyase [Erysipelotrichaceae bacterium]
MKYERIKVYQTPHQPNGEYICYWMQSAQRYEYNHALHFAITQANEKKLPLVVYFGLTDTYPEANARHYWFLIQGLQEVATTLYAKQIPFHITHQEPKEGILELLDRCALLVCDGAVLRHERDWREFVSERCPCEMVEIDTNCIVPLAHCSNKEEYSAATLRRKITPLISYFADDFIEEHYHGAPVPSLAKSFDIHTITEQLEGFNVNRAVGVVAMHGGRSAALTRFQAFLETQFEDYHSNRNEPVLNATSGMSPYLHFGQVSSQELYHLATLWTNQHPTCETSFQAFKEELIVRRELAFNFVHYNTYYDSYQCLPNWALDSLELHNKDLRPYYYELEVLEQGASDDPYWNAAQKQLVLTGSMHGYMRMYWGKKLLEWGSTPKIAFEQALYLNNKYALDGRDPNSFAGIAWIFGKHDRPWTKRAIFGNVRYMNASGLERKMNIKAYVAMIDALEAKEKSKEIL